MTPVACCLRIVKQGLNQRSQHKHGALDQDILRAEMEGTGVLELRKESPVKAEVFQQVSTENLMPGMYVVDLNSGWLDHPFVRTKLKVTKEDIALIRESGIKHVTIDTSKGLSADEGEDPAEAAKRQAEDLIRVAMAEPESGEEHVSDAHRAKLAIENAVNTIRELMSDAKMGRALNFASLHAVAETVAKEIIENPAMAVAVFHMHKQCEYTYAHCIRVAVLSAATAHKMGLSWRECSEIAFGGLVHDIGKMLVDPKVLYKPGKLTDQEMDHMRGHVDLGTNLVKIGEIPNVALRVLREHHERYDGKGYPHKLVGDQISIYGRIRGSAGIHMKSSNNPANHRI